MTVSRVVAGQKVPKKIAAEIPQRISGLILVLHVCTAFLVLLNE